MTSKIFVGTLWAGTLALAYFIGIMGRDSTTELVDSAPSGELGSSFRYLERTADRDKVKSGLEPFSTDESKIIVFDESKGAWTSGLENLPLEQLLSTSGDEGRPATPEEIREVLGAALTSDNLVDRNRAIADMLAGLTAENASVALRVFENTPRAYHTDNNFRLFMHAWGKVDGKAALEYVRNNPDAHRVGGSAVWAMSGWTQSDPGAALDFVTSMEKPDHGLYHGLIRGWGRVDLNAANEFVAGFKTEDRDLKRRLVSVIGESYVEQQGVAGALEWTARTARESDNHEFASAALDDVLKRAVSQSPSLAAEWISANPDHPHVKPWMFEHTAGRMADKDPRMAAEWLSQNLDHKRLDGRAVGRVASEWAERDPAEAARWAETFRETKLFNKELTSRLAGTWASRDSEAAFKWAEGLKTDLRRSALGSIVGRMPRRELEKTGEWIRNAPPESVMDGARAAYASRIAREKPNEALEQALLMTDALGRERVAVPIVQRMFKKDPEAFKEWLPNSGLSVPAQQRIIRGQ